MNYLNLIKRIYIKLDKRWSPDIEELFMNELQSYNPNIIENCLKDIESSLTTEMMIKPLSLIQMIKQRYSAHVDTQKLKTHCNFCENKGVIYMFKQRAVEADYAFACICEHSKKELPKWNGKRFYHIGENIFEFSGWEYLEGVYCEQNNLGI